MLIRYSIDVIGRNAKNWQQTGQVQDSGGDCSSVNGLEISDREITTVGVRIPQGITQLVEIDDVTALARKEIIVSRII